jgi:hypothetical protein
VNRQEHSAASNQKNSPWREPAKRADFENELRQRIAEDQHAKRFFAYLTGQAGFGPYYVIGSLIRDAFG